MAVGASKLESSREQAGTSDSGRSAPVGRLWYVRRGKNSRGPFPAEAIRRFIMLGRIKPDDELSTDKENWSLPGNISMFAATQDEPAPAAYDERSGFDRRSGEATDARPRGQDRRRSESPETIRKRQERQQRLLDQDSSEKSQAVLWPVVVLLALIGFAVAFALSQRSDDSSAVADCSSAPAPGVIWRACKLTLRDYEGASLAGADLSNSYAVSVNLLSADLRGANLDWAQLSGARLSYAQLETASLRGADLTGADLRYAQLNNAQLSYANLSGARIGGAKLEGVRLDAAIWIDGRTCASPSTGSCL